MRNIGLAAFCATTCVLVPAALHTLTASSKQVAKLAAPDQQAMIINGVKVDATVDKAIVDAGDKVHVKLKATGDKNQQKVTVDVLVLEATGTGGGRVESPPNKVALEQVSLLANGAERDLSFTLRGYRGQEMEGTSPFGRYTILVMRPRDAKRLDKLRRIDGKGDMGYNEEFFEALGQTGEQTPDENDAPTQDQDGSEEPVGKPGTSARLSVVTRPASSNVSIKAPEKVRAEETFAVTVRVKNTSQKKIEKMRVELSKPEMLNVEHYQGLSDDKVEFVDDTQTVALAPRETKSVTFHVRASEAGIVGLYAHTFSDEDYSMGDIALDAVEVGAAAPAVVGKR